MSEEKKWSPYSSKFESWTEDKYGPFLDALEKYGAYLYACDTLRVNNATVLEFRKENPEFQRACDEAIRRYHASFVTAAADRVRNGVAVPIIGGRERDQVVAEEIKYPERLTELFLKRADPTFSEKQIVEVTPSFDLEEKMNLRQYSRAARLKLREFLEQVKEDERREAMGEVVER